MISYLKQFSMEMLVLLCSGLLSITYVLIKNHLKNINTKMDKALNKIDLVMIEQQSTDYALHKSFKNGFSDYKAEKKGELMKDYELLYKERVL